MDVNFWGADLKRFCAGDCSKARARLGIPVDAPVILSPQAVDPTCNTALIVLAFRRVLVAQPRALLVVLGRCSIPEYIEKIKMEIKRLGIGDSVIWLGEVDQETLIDHTVACDVVVSMASSEGFPNTVLEVMDCEAPIVAGRIRQIEELLENGVHATLCEIEKEEIAEAIVDAFDQPERTTQMVRHAKELVVRQAGIIKNGCFFADRLRIVCRDAKRHSWFQIFSFRLAFVIYLAFRRIKRTIR